MDKNRETKSLRDIMEYANSKVMSNGALLKLEETYRELLEDKDEFVE